jgi:hypothetical protein
VCVCVCVCTLLYLIRGFAWQSEKQSCWSEYEDDTKPCSDQCSLQVFFFYLSFLGEKSLQHFKLSAKVV